MTEAEAFKKLVAAYGLKLDTEQRDIFGRIHYVLFPRQHDDDTYCCLNSDDFALKLTPDFHANLFGGTNLFGGFSRRALNYVIKHGMNMCKECQAKFDNILIDYKSLEELDILLTLIGANNHFFKLSN